MKLKHYQEKVLSTLGDYLGALIDAKSEYYDLLNYKPTLAKHVDFPKDAWEKTTGKKIIIVKAIRWVNIYLMFI